MSITTIEALEGLAPGEKVWVTTGRTGKREYVRVEDGFKVSNDRTGTVLGSHLFTGLVQSGLVTQVDTTPVRVRDVFRSPQYAGLARVLIVGHTEAGDAHCVYFRSGNYYNQRVHAVTALREGGTWVRVPPEDYEPWVTTAIGMARVMTRAIRERDEAKLLLSEARGTLERMSAESWTDVSEVKITGRFTVDRMNG